MQPQMHGGFHKGPLLLLLLTVPAFAQWDDGLLKPSVMDHRAGGASPSDVSFLLDAPAGKDGFIGIQGGHFVKPGGRRIRFWGVHLTDWSHGSILLPSHEDAALSAASLARYGINMKNLSADISTQFAAIALSSLDAKSLSESSKMLLAAGSRVTNTGLKWNDAHTRTANQGESPSLIEPVSGTVVLRAIQSAKAVTASALDGAGHAIGEPLQAKKIPAGWSLTIGTPVTTWYVVSVQR